MNVGQSAYHGLSNTAFVKELIVMLVIIWIINIFKTVLIISTNSTAQLHPRVGTTFLLFMFIVYLFLFFVRFYLKNTNVGI